MDKRARRSDLEARGLVKLAMSQSFKQFVALAGLVILGAFSFLRPILLGDTIDLDLFLAIPVLFWVTLAYGLILPFLAGWMKNRRVLTLWGTIMNSLFWSYFTIAEPVLRFPDSYVHSRSALLLINYGVNPSVEQYLLWPGSFILQDVTSFVTGLPLLTISKILAIILVALIGLVLMNFFSGFFDDSRKALLCLYVTFIAPNTLMLTTQHYSPQLFTYLLVLVVMSLVHSARVSVQKSALLILLLSVIVVSNPTTIVWLTPILVGVWILEKRIEKPHNAVISNTIIILFLAMAAGWWIQPSGVALADTLRAFADRFAMLVGIGKLNLSEGVFSPSYQPFYSFLVRRLTFVFVGVLLVPLVFELYRGLNRLVRGRFLNKDEAFFVAVVVGSLAGTMFFWIGAAGLYGDRTWAILILVMAVFCVRSIFKVSERKKIIGGLLVAAVLILIPLNFIATNYGESLNQTTASEFAAINFVSLQNFYDQRVFSDNALTLGRFTYAMPDPSNVFFSKSSYSLNYTVAANSTFLDDARDFWSQEKWTIFIHSSKTQLLIYGRFGVHIGELEEFNEPTINKIYDDGEIRLYKR